MAATSSFDHSSNAYTSVQFQELPRIILINIRPVGFIKINGMRVDAISESGVIEADTPVIVTDAYDNQLKVRPH